MSAGSSAAPHKQSALHLQIKLPCATLDALCERYGPGLKQGLLFVRTSRPRGEGTLVRLEAQLADGSPCLRAAATVERVVEPPELEPGMELKLLAVDEAGRALLERLGGPLLRAVKSEAFANSVFRATTSSAGQAAPATVREGPSAPQEIASRSAPPTSASPPLPNAPPTSSATPISSQTAPAPSASAPDPATPRPPLAPAAREPVLGIDLGRRSARAAWMEQGRPRPLADPPLPAASARGRSTEELAGALRELKRSAERECGVAIAQAVITVQAGSSSEERAQLEAAAGLAGLRVEALLEEPIAVALAFADGRALEQKLLVYSLGASGFCVSLVEVRGRVFERVHSLVDPALGGIEFDRAIAEHLRESFREQHGRELPADAATEQQLQAAAERLKLALSDQLEAQLRERFGAETLELTVSRTELVLLSGALVERTLQLCRELMQALELRARDLDQVLLVGGQSRMPLLRERLRNLFGVEPALSLDAGEAAVRGAALLGGEREAGAARTTVLVKQVDPAAQMHGTPSVSPSGPAEEGNAPAPVQPVFDPSAETAEMSPARAPPAPRRGWLRGLFGKS